MFRFFLLLSVALLASCGSNSAIDRTENYIYAWPNINYEMNEDITIGVIDHREYVTNDKVDPSYVGIMRGGYGNPWYMHTESGKPLADDISQAVVSGFLNSGIDAKNIRLNPKASIKDAASNLNSSDSSKKLLIIIGQWKSDTYKNTNFYYQLTVKTYDQSGENIASYTAQSSDDGASVVSPMDAGRKALTEALNAKPIMSSLN